MSDYIKLVEDTMNALRILSEADEGVGVREISRLLDLNKSTCHRMLLTLQKENIVEFNETTQKYHMSLGIMQLTSKSIQKNDLLTISLPHMNHLRDVTGETIGLHVRVLNNRLVVAKVESNHELRWSPVIGKPYPLYLGAASKVISAFMPTELYQELLNYLPGNIQREAFIKDIQLVKQRSYAVSFGEIEQGGVGVAAPILDKFGNLRAAVSIYGLANRVSEDKLGFLIDEVLKTTRKISEELIY